MTSIRILLWPIRQLMVWALVFGVAFPTVVTTGVCRAARESNVRKCCACAMMKSMMMAARPGGAHRICPATADQHPKPSTCTVVQTPKSAVAGASTDTTPYLVHPALAWSSAVRTMVLNAGPPQYHRFNSGVAGFALAPLRGKCVLII